MFHGRAWKVTSFGDPDKALRLQDTSWSEPIPGKLLIRVCAAGAGYPDVMMTRGLFPGLSQPPFGLGEEATGYVVAAPLGSRFAVGDRVMGITAFAEGCGGYADHAYLREQSTITVSTSMTDEEAGGFPIAFRTAHAALIERGAVSPGEVLVVLGAAGSSGSAAVQLGKALGATVVAVAGSDEKLEFCRRIGADHVVNYRSGALLDEVATVTGGRGADVVFDPVGGAVGQQALQSLRRYGRHLIVGFASGATLPVESTDLLMRNVSAVGVHAGGFTPDEDATAWTRLSTLAQSGQIRTPVGSTYDFAEVPAMVTRLSSPAPGKSIVMMK